MRALVGVPSCLVHVEIDAQARLLTRVKVAVHEAERLLEDTAGELAARYSWMPKLWMARSSCSAAAIVLPVVQPLPRDDRDGCRPRQLADQVRVLRDDRSLDEGHL